MAEESAALVIEDDDAPEVLEAEESQEEDQEEGQEEKKEPKADKPDEDEEEARVEFTPEQQAKVDEIARKAAARNLEKLQEAVEGRQRAEEQLARYQPRQDEQQGRPVVPPPPDPFDEGYEQKLQQRDEALQRAAQWDAVYAIARHQNEAKEREQQQASQAEVEKTVSTYTSRAHKMGIKDAELQLAGRQIQAVGMSGELVEHILRDSQGPALTVYLANNLDELDKIRQMSPTSAAIYLENQVKPKAARQPKKPPPPTLDPVRGSGSNEGRLGGKGLLIE